MPSLIIPDTKSMQAMTLNDYIARPSIEDATYEGETISRGEYIKKFLFDNKHYDVIEVIDDGTMTYWPTASWGRVCLDPEYNNRAVLCAHSYQRGLIYCDPHIDISSYSKSWNYDAVASCVMFGLNSSGDVPIQVKSFDSFVWFHNATGYNTQYDKSVTMVYDYANHEMLIYTYTLGTIFLTAPDALNYSPVLTIDGNGANQWFPTIRGTSVEEVSYAPITRLDGVEATRMYFVNKMPDRATWETLKVGDKYFLILPYDTSTSSGWYGSGGSERFCAIAIDVTEDLANQ